MALPLTQLRLLDAPLGAFTVLDVDTANDLLVEWGHNLGRCERPFRSEAWVLELEGEPVSLALSASAVSDTVAGYRRGEVVELARLCTKPGESWATRIMLRFWRERCAPRWQCWPVKAAIAYSQNAQHPGSIYRTDGWEKVREDAGSSGGGTYSTLRRPGDSHHGAKTLWVWRYS